MPILFGMMASPLSCIHTAVPFFIGYSLYRRRSDHIRSNKKKDQCSVKRSRRRTININGRFSICTDLTSTVDTVPSSLLTKQEQNFPVV